MLAATALWPTELFLKFSSSGAKPASKYSVKKDKVKAKILELYDNYRTLQKKKGCKSNEAKEKVFTEELTQYLFIAHQDAQAKVETDRLRTRKQKDEDLEFLSALQSQKKVSLGSEDKTYKKKVERKMKRTSLYLEKKYAEKQSKDRLLATIADAEHSGQESYNESADSSSVSDEELVCNVKEKNVTKEVRTETALLAKASFTGSASKYATQHWDGKIVPGDSERLAVLIAGLPDHKGGKLLGVPVIPDGTGTTQEALTYALTQEWSVENAIFGLVFDTTASNSGWKNGACVKLETLFGKKVFYFACRHHVMKRILCAFWQELFGETSSPDTPEFKEFQKSWDSVVERSTFKTLDIRDRRLKHQQEIVGFLHELLSLPESDDASEDAMPRDDYRESAELMLILL
jgi:hypothetical protein